MTNRPRRMRTTRLTGRRLAVGFAMVALSVGLVPPSSPATAAPIRPIAAPRLTTIAPGHHPTLNVSIPVNIVFVGYGHDAVNVNRMLGQLPKQGAPIIREPGFLGIHQSVGLNYSYRYQPRFAGKQFDDAFFGYLGRSGYVAGPEYFQRQSPARR